MVILPAELQQTGSFWTAIVMYVGPDLLMPIVSALAAVAGVLLMFWHRTVGFVVKVSKSMLKRKG